MSQQISSSTHAYLTNPIDYVSHKGGSITISSCGMFKICKKEDLFAIQEIGGKSNYIYRGDYTHSFINKHLTKMRKPLFREFLSRLPELNSDYLFTMTVMQFHKLNDKLKEFYQEEHSMFKKGNTLYFK